MSKLDDLQIEPTSKEVEAFTRLGDNKDFRMLNEYLVRSHVSRMAILLKIPRDDQEFDLIKYQGGYDFHNRMLGLVDKTFSLEDIIIDFLNKR